MQPWGINLAFADGIPLAARTAKALQLMLPDFDQVATIWLASCWLLQPVAAVFALRGAGCTRTAPAGYIPILALCDSRPPAAIADGGEARRPCNRIHSYLRTKPLAISHRLCSCSVPNPILERRP